MLKGIARQIVVLRNTDSDIFEEAIFILKDNTEIDRKDMLYECQRIINQNCNTTKSKKKKPKRIYYVLFPLLSILIITIALLTLIL